MCFVRRMLRFRTCSMFCVYVGGIVHVHACFVFVAFVRLVSVGSSSTNVVFFWLLVCLFSLSLPFPPCSSFSALLVLVSMLVLPVCFLPRSSFFLFFLSCVALCLILYVIAVVYVLVVVAVFRVPCLSSSFSSCLSLLFLLLLLLLLRLLLLRLSSSILPQQCRANQLRTPRKSGPIRLLSCLGIGIIFSGTMF